MARTLNPQLFGSTSAPTASANTDLIGQVAVRKVRDVEIQVETLDQKIEKWVQILDSKIQKLQAGQKSLADQMKMMSDHFTQQTSTLHNRLNERRAADAKVQELVDRHNQLVHNFELRLSQLQKLSSEQEMKLMTYQATYDEVLREIRGLKTR